MKTRSYKECLREMKILPLHTVQGLASCSDKKMSATAITELDRRTKRAMRMWNKELSI